MASPGATRAIVSLGWPMLVGQLAVMANGVIDNVMAGHLSARDLASVAIGSSVYYMVFVGLMGTMQAISPVAAQHHGAGRWHAVGETWRQGQWLAAALLLPGGLALAFPGALLSLAGAEPAVEAGAVAYLNALAFGLPAALWFRGFTTLNTAVSRPRVVMAINLLGPACKVPLNLLFMHGSDAPVALGLPAIPAMGGAGCGVATAVVFWVSAAIGFGLLRHDRFYVRFALGGIGRSGRTRTAAGRTSGKARGRRARRRCRCGRSQCRPRRRTSGLEGRHPRRTAAAGRPVFQTACPRLRSRFARQTIPQRSGIGQSRVV